MSFCTFEQIDATTFRCSTCGKVYRNIRTHRVIAKCGKPEIVASVTGSVHRLLTVVLVGDVIEVTANRLGIARLVAWLEQITGEGCGCKSRQDRLNLWQHRQAQKIEWLVSLPLRGIASIARRYRPFSHVDG